MCTYTYLMQNKKKVLLETKIGILFLKYGIHVFLATLKTPLSVKQSLSSDCSMFSVSFAVRLVTASLSHVMN